MNLKNKNKIIIVISVFTLLIISLTFLYLSKINIYHKINIEIYQDEINVSNDFVCKGYTVFNRELDIQSSESNFLIPKNTYLNRLELSTDTPTDDITDYKLVVLKNNEEIVNKHFNGELLITDIYKDNSLKSKFNLLAIVLESHLRTIKIIWFLLSFIIYIVLFAKQKSLFVRVLVLVIFIANVFWYYYAIFSNIYSPWAGLFPQITIYSIILLISHYILKNKEEKRKNILTSISSLVIVILCAEVVLRLFGINATYFEIRESCYKSISENNKIREYHTHKSNSIHYLQAKEFSFSRETNSMGLSDIELKHDSTKHLVLALGDSFTEGDGAHSDSTWVKYLERSFLSQDSVLYKFFNAGVCGSDPFYEYKLLKEKLVSYKPEVVIVAYGYDLNDIIIRGGMERFDNYETKIKDPWWESIYKSSYTFRLLVRNLFGYNDLLLNKVEYEQEKQRAINQIKESINLFYKLSQANNFELLIVFYPQKNELADGKYMVNNIFIEYCNNNKINNLDLLDYYGNDLNIKDSEIQDYYWEIDGHHNSAGYKIFSDGVYLKLIEMGY